MKHILKWTALAGSALLLAGPASVSAQGVPDVARRIAGLEDAQARIMWIDGSANLRRTVIVNGAAVQQDFTTTEAGVSEIVSRCRRAEINTLVVDVKPLSGNALWFGKTAPRLTEWRGSPVPHFDVLEAFVRLGHASGLRVFACINTLSEGHKLFRVGPGFAHPEWQSVVYGADRGITGPDGSRLSVHVAPEPGDDTRPAVLTPGSSITTGAPESGLVGLEAVIGPEGNVSAEAGAPLGHQMNLMLDASNRVVGLIDSAMLGDDPLVPPEEGRLITARSANDQAWMAAHLAPGDTVRYSVRAQFASIADTPTEKVALFVNPLIPEVRTRILDVVKEICSNYAVDGLVLDRCRYSNLNNDFSPLSRAAFERRIGRPVHSWPQDIFRFAQVPGMPPELGPLFKPWLEFRAANIRRLVSDIAAAARRARPGISLGAYVGSWYPKYYEVGVNWGSEDTALRYPWFTEEYPRTGYAPFFDWISPGCYYPTATREDARRAGANERATVEYASAQAEAAVSSSSFVYPGLYMPDYSNHPERLVKAIKAATAQSEGVMIFDLSYIEQFNWWPVLQEAFGKDAPAPDQFPDLLPLARSLQDAD